ncbi:protein-L-isoaspartate O-methyltransferase [Bosea sp. (in: a-proteobacteria)]|uniref:protein-L-isoaspartate O-methyltransferase family protein n=1 Tax=Bosea sp. (in: a-proteobacteria) TaxID=1871050 RepID=UPI00273777BD|nr:protein-L-isoaspartate O-methyltransferase [Bosea sp. (in: a-proteobacteria)]MDP3410418.1 protein-L-isoaspartate O-methyltransferase [Bosea sp. (in: a-proteobacteria)]
MDSFAPLRRMMVDCQLRTYDVTDRAVLAAADEVAREAFMPASLSHLAYLDQAVALPGTGRALMAPMVVARMIQTLELQPGDQALEYGGGSGYGAALMSAMGAQATLWEPDEAARAMAESALAATGSAAAIAGGRPTSEAFDAIVVGGACETQPEMLFALLRDGGRLIAIEGSGRAARVMLYQKSGGKVSGRPVFDAAAPALAEFARKPAFVF